MDNLNILLEEANNIFKKEESVLYSLIKSSFFHSNYLIQDFLFDMFSLKLHFYYQENPISYYYKHQLLFLFHQKLTKIKVFFTIEYKCYNNYKSNVFNSLTLKDQISSLGLIARALKEESIITLFSLPNKKIDSLLNNQILLEKIKDVYKDFLSLKLKIIIKKQELSSKYEDLIKEFLDRINIIQEKYKTFKICDLIINSNQKGIKMDLVTFSIIYKKTKFKVQLSQVNFKLYAYLYYNSLAILKDRIYCLNDFERVFYYLKEDYFS